MDLSSVPELSDMNFLLNTITLLISFAAVIYWMKFFRRISISGKQGIGWVWIFTSVLMVLLLNLSAVVIISNTSIIPLGFTKVSLVAVSTLELMNTLGRTLVAVSVTIGSYLLCQSMRARGNVKFVFTPVKPSPEPKSQSTQKYKLKVGYSYLVPKNTLAEYESHNTEAETSLAMDLFADLVTHGSLGFIVTRDHPKRIRERYNLLKTPMVWLAREQTGSDTLPPTDLAELNHIIKEFIHSTDDSVVLINGLEYLIIHNSFGETLELIQGLNDVVVQSTARLIVSVDLRALTEQQQHILASELAEYTHK
ncbi:MAG: DUF835 domain-containing protein [Candidatus Altiarchaeota archaeon]